eukprot:1159867-Pelagomonas_calceolata.AAC.4
MRKHASSFRSSTLSTDKGLVQLHSPTWTGVEASKSERKPTDKRLVLVHIQLTVGTCTRQLALTQGKHTCTSQFGRNGAKGTDLAGSSRASNPSQLSFQPVPQRHAALMPMHIAAAAGAVPEGPKAYEHRRSIICVFLNQHDPRRRSEGQCLAVEQVPCCGAQALLLSKHSGGQCLAIEQSQL